MCEKIIFCIVVCRRARICRSDGLRGIQRRHVRDLPDMRSCKTEERAVPGVYMHDDELREYAAYDKSRQLSVYPCIEIFDRSSDAGASLIWR